MKNSALLFKWWWRYACEENSFWRKVVKSIHNENSALIPANSGSRIPEPWQIKKMVKAQSPIARAFLQQMKITVGNGVKTRF